MMIDHHQPLKVTTPRIRGDIINQKTYSIILPRIYTITLGTNSTHSTEATKATRYKRKKRHLKAKDCL